MSSLDKNEIRPDANNLYREESITDMKVASLRRFVPITVDGEPDASRKAFFMAQTHVMSQAGPLPVNARIDTDSLAEALEKFPDAVEEGLRKLMEEAREYQREEASRIVVPPKGSQGTIQMP